jgi:hypothetical protein
MCGRGQNWIEGCHNHGRRGQERTCFHLNTPFSPKKAGRTDAAARLANFSLNPFWIME